MAVNHLVAGSSPAGTFFQVNMSILTNLITPLRASAGQLGSFKNHWNPDSTPGVVAFRFQQSFLDLVLASSTLRILAHVLKGSARLRSKVLFLASDPKLESSAVLLNERHRFAAVSTHRLFFMLQFIRQARSFFSLRTLRGSHSKAKSKVKSKAKKKLSVLLSLLRIRPFLRWSVRAIFQFSKLKLNYVTDKLNERFRFPYFRTCYFFGTFLPGGLISNWTRFRFAESSIEELVVPPDFVVNVSTREIHSSLESCRFLGIPAVSAVDGDLDFSLPMFSLPANQGSIFLSRFLMGFLGDFASYLPFNLNHLHAHRRRRAFSNLVKFRSICLDLRIKSEEVQAVSPRRLHLFSARRFLVQTLLDFQVKFVADSPKNRFHSPTKNNRSHQLPRLFRPHRLGFLRYLSLRALGLDINYLPLPRRFGSRRTQRRAFLKKPRTFSFEHFVLRRFFGPFLRFPLSGYSRFHGNVGASKAFAPVHPSERPRSIGFQLGVEPRPASSFDPVSHRATPTPRTPGPVSFYFRFFPSPQHGFSKPFASRIKNSQKPFGLLYFRRLLELGTVSPFSNSLLVRLGVGPLHDRAWPQFDSRQKKSRGFRLPRSLKLRLGTQKKLKKFFPNRSKRIFSKKTSG